MGSIPPLLSFLLMGMGIIGMTCTPAYRDIGVAAPLLVLFWRLVQGFALAGDVGPCDYIEIGMRGA